MVQQLPRQTSPRLYPIPGERKHSRVYQDLATPAKIIDLAFQTHRGATVEPRRKASFVITADQLEATLPWLDYLPTGERATCVSELMAVLSDHAGNRAFRQVLTEWKHTAEIFADPDLAKRLSSGFSGDGLLISRPAS
ncbi:MAG TPA: hypothetical protein VII96_12275 [Acidimicrobiales bacterium]